MLIKSHQSGVMRERPNGKQGMLKGRKGNTLDQQGREDEEQVNLPVKRVCPEEREEEPTPPLILRPPS